MGGVLQYKWELYCWVSLSSRLRSQEGPAIQMGGALPYNWGCTAVLSLRPVGVGVSETLLIRLSPGKKSPGTIFRLGEVFFWGGLFLCVCEGGGVGFL